MPSSIPEISPPVHDKIPAPEQTDPGHSIRMQAWNPKTPYLSRISGGPGTQRPLDEAYASYVQVREEYLKSPSFFFDVSSLFESVSECSVLRVALASFIFTTCL